MCTEASATGRPIFIFAPPGSTAEKHQRLHEFLYEYGCAMPLNSQMFGKAIESENYIPINADLSIAIKPMVSGDNQITLSINVVQSSFNSKRIDEEAPPGMNTREFNSIVRVKNQDLVILGGLEENVKNDSGSGVPFLARVPIIKWFFSKKTRTKSKKKLSVLIKPTILN